MNRDLSGGMQSRMEAGKRRICYAPPSRMPNDHPRRHVTSRDIEIFVALDRSALTIEQLLKLSQAFEGEPFTSIRSVQDRLQKLSLAGWVQRWRYATASHGASPHYYKLTLTGYRVLYGRDALPPTKRHFSEVAVAHQHHTRCLADFIVHTSVAAHSFGVTMSNFYRENTLCLNVGDDTLYPDCAFELVTPHRRQFNFLVELDNGTERVRSTKDVESWQRKIRLYDHLQRQSYPNRFRVLIVTTRSPERLRHILDAAASLVTNRQRSLFYGVYLPDYLGQPHAVCSACFRDHRWQPVSLLPLTYVRARASNSVKRTIRVAKPVC